MNDIFEYQLCELYLECKHDIKSEPGQWESNSNAK